MVSLALKIVPLIPGSLGYKCLAAIKSAKYLGNGAVAKFCGSCGEVKSHSEFNLAKGRSDGLNGHCKECHRWDHLKRKHGLSKADYEEMHNRQEGCCPLCLRPYPKLHVDHDHACCPSLPTCGQCVRGLLCPPCNRSLGYVEQPEWLERAMNYLGKG